jgi:hypothetical protein
VGSARAKSAHDKIYKTNTNKVGSRINKLTRSSCKMSAAIQQPQVPTHGSEDLPPPAMHQPTGLALETMSTFFIEQVCPPGGSLERTAPTKFCSTAKKTKSATKSDVHPMFQAHLLYFVLSALRGPRVWQRTLRETTNESALMLVQTASGAANEQSSQVSLFGG